MSSNQPQHLIGGLGGNPSHCQTRSLPLLSEAIVREGKSMIYDDDVLCDSKP